MTPSDASRTVVFGGHGKVALLLAPLLAARGAVEAVVRNPDHVDDVAATGATPVVADVEQLSVAALAELVRGADAVVWSAGAGGGDAGRTYAVDRDAAIRTIEACEREGVGRFVMVSWLGSRADHGIDPDDAFFAYADAKWAADERLLASDLAATVVAPGGLTTDAPTGRIRVDPPESGSVARADVAAVAAAVLDEPATIGRTLRFVGGDTSIAEAIRGGD